MNYRTFKSFYRLIEPLCLVMTLTIIVFSFFTRIPNLVYFGMLCLLFLYMWANSIWVRYMVLGELLRVAGYQNLTFREVSLSPCAYGGTFVTSFGNGPIVSGKVRSKVFGKPEVFISGKRIN